MRDRRTLTRYAWMQRFDNQCRPGVRVSGIKSRQTIAIFSEFAHQQSGLVMVALNEIHKRSSTKECFVEPVDAIPCRPRPRVPAVHLSL
jgi:hypothetical protein